MDFLFEDLETGEYFFVELEENNRQQAIKIAKEYFESPKLIDILSQEEADILGYDTY